MPLPLPLPMPLHQRFPGTAAIPFAGIAELPTPIDSIEPPPCPELAELGALLVKRDDVTSARYGGNKVRKLDFLLGDAIEQGRRAVLTFGAYGSNHALATAVHARALGLEPHAVLSPQDPGPYAPRTLLAHAGLGTHLHLVEGWDGRREAVVAKRELTERDGIEPYIIPMGGTCPLGAVGYVNAAFEVAFEVEQDVARDATGPLPDVVYLAAGTLGTAVGLAIGFACAARATGAPPIRVEAIRVTPLEICNDSIAETLTAETIALLRARDASFPDIGYADLNLSLRHEFFEPGYGVVTDDTRHAVEVAASAGLKLETTYTGKGFSAMMRDGETGVLGGKRVLFWNTYSSAPYPEPGPVEALPAVLREYIAECERLFGPLAR